MKKSRSKKIIPFRYDIGDLVACYESPNTYKIIIGWISERWVRDNRNFYKVEWSDMDERRHIINTPIDEVGLEPCYNLLQKAIKLDIWTGKKIS